MSTRHLLKTVGFLAMLVSLLLIASCAQQPGRGASGRDEATPLPAKPQIDVDLHPTADPVATTLPVKLTNKDQPNLDVPLKMRSTNGDGESIKLPLHLTGEADEIKVKLSPWVDSQQELNFPINIKPTIAQMDGHDPSRSPSPPPDDWSWLLNLALAAICLLISAAGGICKAVLDLNLARDLFMPADGETQPGTSNLPVSGDSQAPSETEKTNGVANSKPHVKKRPRSGMAAIFVNNSIRGIVAGAMMPFLVLMWWGELYGSERKNALLAVLLASACLVAGFWGAKLIELVDETALQWLWRIKKKDSTKTGDSQ